VGTIEGVTFYNDSKATNPESLMVALRAFLHPVVLLAGGRPKGGDYRPLTPLLARHTTRILLIGEAQDLLAEAWSGSGVPLERAGRDFEGAVRRAFAAAKERGTDVLLSPGCASFDMFQNFEDRGDRFREIVARLGEGR
jgi:UDP-N-acetylmuramoylalanine--D-glutamate ligase